MDSGYAAEADRMHHLNNLIITTAKPFFIYRIDFKGSSSAFCLHNALVYIGYLDMWIIINNVDSTSYPKILAVVKVFRVPGTLPSYTKLSSWGNKGVILTKMLNIYCKSSS
jgi:hypothetical protein